MKVKRKTFAIINPASEGDIQSKIFDVSIMVLICLNLLALILETVNSLSAQFGHFFHLFELFSVAVFSMEYGLRVWSCVQEDRYRSPVKGRARFMLTPMAVIDLLAVLPFYLPFFIALDLRFIRVLRLFRIFRIFKLGRYSKSTELIAIVMRSRKEELTMVIFIVVVLLIFASSLMYFVESSAQPEAFSSIPTSMWWGVATLTTVGYGDVYPITPLGKLLSAIITILGIGIFALPTGILASGFTDELQRQREGTICPHCKKRVD